MTRQSQKNEEMQFAQKAGELLGETWGIKESPNEKEWPDLMILNETIKFGLEVRSIFKDEGQSGSELKKLESFRVDCLKKLSQAYYRITDIPIMLRIRGDLKKSDIERIALFLKKKAEFMREDENLDIEVGVKLYITRLRMQLENYNRWQNVNDYVGWVSEFMRENIERSIRAKESKIEKYRKNVSDIRLLLVLNRNKNSGRAELEDNIGEFDSKFNEIYVMLYPEKIHRLNRT
jgi:hypothetical protein